MPEYEEVLAQAKAREEKKCESVGVYGAAQGLVLNDLCRQANPEEMRKREEEAKRQCDTKTAIMVLNFLEVGPNNPGGYLGVNPYGPFCNELKELCIKKLAEGVK